MKVRLYFTGDMLSQRMAELVIEHLSKSFGRVAAVRDANLRVAEGELMTLVGPSGCGKTTTLRLIAGLEKPSGGVICIAGRTVNGLQPARRDVAMTFQDHSLYPHMTVRQNLAFPLRMRRTPRSEIGKHVSSAAAMLGLSDLLDRKPGELSGGEAQRAALGRAIIVQPKVLLLDEPLSNLDVNLRGRLRTELKSLQRQLRMTTLFVTHDQEEAMALGDRLAVMHGGSIVQIGEPMEVYQRPMNRFVAVFLGRPGMNFIAGRLSMHGALPVFHDRGDVHLGLERMNAKALAAYEGQEVSLGVRPEHVRMVRRGLPCRDVSVRATVMAVEVTGPAMHITARTTAGDSLTAVHRMEPEMLKLTADETVLAELDSAALMVFEQGESGRNLTLEATDSQQMTQMAQMGS